jgi:transposase
MNATSTPPPADWREGRRLRAWELHQQGWSQTRIAQALGITQGAVSQWFKRAQAEGATALRRRLAAGSRPRLTPEQSAQVPGLLGRGPEAYGLRGQIWTCARVGLVIKRSFGVSYHPAHISRLLKRLRFSLQRPIRRARQRKPAVIQDWRDTQAKALKKKPTPSSEPWSL